MIPAAQLRRIRTLIVDDQSTMRSMLRSVLAEAQIRDVTMARDAEAALALLLERSGQGAVPPFDLVLCDYHLGEATDGQQLLEHMRAARLLRPGMVFFMVTGEASRDKVACAGELRPDGYLIKPPTAAALLGRLEEALARQEALRPVYEAMAGGDPAGALAHADRMLNPSEASASPGEGVRPVERYRFELLRNRAICLAELVRWDEALATYRSALALRGSLPWARYGEALCLVAMGELHAASPLLESLLRDHPYHAAAHELSIEVHERAGESERALAAAVRANEWIPSTQRARRLAELALRTGRADVAESAFGRIVATTSRSLTQDVADTASLAQACLENGDAVRAMEVLNTLRRGTNPHGSILSAAIEAQLPVGGTSVDAGLGEAIGRLREVAATGLPGAGVRVLSLVGKAALKVGLRDEGVRLLTEAVRRSDSEPSGSGLAGAAVVTMRASAARALSEAGLPEAAAALPQDRGSEAARQARLAERTMRAGQLADALSLADAALEQAPQSTEVLLCVCEIHLLAARFMFEPSQAGQGMSQRAALERLDRLGDLLDRLRSRGTIDPDRLERMERYLEGLRLRYHAAFAGEPLRQGLPA